MTKQAAQDRCNQLGMRLPTFREAILQELLTSGSENINPRIFTTVEHPLRDSICLLPTLDPI